MARERRRRPLPRADQLRRHREEMQFALVNNCSLEEARRRLASYREHLPRLAAPLEDVVAELPLAAAETADRPLQWWQRD